MITQSQISTDAISNLKTGHLIQCSDDNFVNFYLFLVFEPSASRYDHCDVDVDCGCGHPVVSVRHSLCAGDQVSYTQNLIPLPAKRVKELANLIERKNPHTPVYGIKEFVCLYVCDKL